jgi:hypothetical protein
VYRIGECDICAQQGSRRLLVEVKPNGSNVGEIDLHERREWNANGVQDDLRDREQRMPGRDAGDLTGRIEQGR